MKKLTARRRRHLAKLISDYLDAGEVEKARALFDRNMPDAVGNLRSRLEAAEAEAGS